MYVMTTHGTLIFMNKSGALIHSHFSDASTDLTPIHISPDELTKTGPAKYMISVGPLRGSEITFNPFGLNISKDGLFFCADPKDPLLATRTSASVWERFIFVPTDLEGLDSFRTHQEAEMKRFQSRVAELGQKGEPVKIYCGSGTIPRSGFLNLDFVFASPQFYISNMKDYFIFPFAALKWDIPNDTVDYVFHEDFIEHIDQTSQFQFLAETLRVMKPGSWHRVNTPNLITAMKYNSDFTKGFEGVYTGERNWEHIAIYSPMSLKEVAETIGYREVVFTTQNCGLSPYAEADFRPGPDRDAILGNIYADLLK